MELPFPAAEAIGSMTLKIDINDQARGSFKP
jgi:hypothetical protein